MRRAPFTLLVVILLLSPVTVFAQEGQMDVPEQGPSDEEMAAAVQRYLAINSEFSTSGLEDLGPVDIVVERLDEKGMRRTGLTAEDLHRTFKAALLGSGTVDLSSDETAGGEGKGAFIYLNVSLRPLDNGVETLCCIDIHVERPLYFFGDDGSFAVKAAPWSQGSTPGIAPDDMVADGVKSIIRDFVDDFTIDYFEANPRTPDTPD
jgi:hypothetical protein